MRELIALALVLAVACAPVEVGDDPGDAEDDRGYEQIVAKIGPPTLTNVSLTPDFFGTYTVDNWTYPASGREITCYVDDGAYVGGLADGTSSGLGYTFQNVPIGMHQLCCVLTEDGVELESCAATACVPVAVSTLCDNLSDPVCEDENPISASACLWDANLQHRKCVYGFMDIEGICLSKYDCECDPIFGWPLCIDSFCTQCLQDSDCDDGDPCTSDTCQASNCINEQIYFGDALCCSGGPDAPACDDDDPCTTDSCVGIDPLTLQGTCVNGPAFPGLCQGHDECIDDAPCTVGLCTTLGSVSGCPECRQVPTKEPLCCDPANGDVDCDDGTPCTVDLCNPTSQQCQYIPLSYLEQVMLFMHCCEDSADCQAGGLWEEEPSDNPATMDFCNQGQCVHVIDPDYCECDDGDGCVYPCTGDENPCTTDLCDLETNTCVHAPIEMCCSSDEDCDDWDVCTEDICQNNFCIHQGTPWCPCVTHAQCNDGNPCNLDICANGACHHSPNPELPNCCVSDVDCDDLNTCTEENCIVDIHQCVMSLADPPPAGKECCFTDLQCNDGDPLTPDLCIDNVCFFFMGGPCYPGEEAPPPVMMVSPAPSTAAAPRASARTPGCPAVVPRTSHATSRR